MLRGKTSRYLASVSFFLCLVMFSGFVSASEISTTLQPGWHLVSLPGKPDSQLSACGFFGQNKIYGVRDGGYVSCADGLSELTSGAGYWVFVDGETKYGFDGAAIPPDKPYSISLHKGWNIIGDPFLSRISISEGLKSMVPLSANRMQCATTFWGLIPPQAAT